MRQRVIFVFGLAAVTCGGVASETARGSLVTPVPLTEKEQIEQRHQQESLVSPAPKGDPIEERPTVVVTNRPAPTGVLDTPVAPFPSAQFRATNRWNGYVGEHLMAVIAGGPPNSRVAKLAVITFDKAGLSALNVMWVEFPELVGRPRIASATGTNLVISTESGQTFTFDALTKRLSALP